MGVKGVNKKALHKIGVGDKKAFNQI